MCDKKKYESCEVANCAIRTIKKRSSRSEIPKRTYYCKECNGWHITKIAKWDK